MKWNEKESTGKFPMAKVKICDCHINKADSHNTKGIKWTVSKGEKWITWKSMWSAASWMCSSYAIVERFYCTENRENARKLTIQVNYSERKETKEKTKILFKKKAKKEESILKVSLTLWSMRMFCIEFKVQDLFAKRHSKVFE